MGIDYAGLSRHPDITAPGLRAHDATDILLLERAAEISDRFRGMSGHDVAVIGDTHGALTLSLTLPESAGGYGLRGVRVFQDALLSERALARNAERLGGSKFLEAVPFVQHELDERLCNGVRLVIMQLPKSLAELEELAYWVSRGASPDAVIIAGGRVKHMAVSQTHTLARYFESVQASLAVKKSRLLIAQGVSGSPADPPFPVIGQDPDLSFSLHAYGSTFGGASLDHGSRLMLQHLASVAPHARHIVDLGCGSGVLAVSAALARPEARIIASDQSWGAVRAAAATARSAGVSDRVEVVRADACEAIPTGWADLVLLNPPFHSGHIVAEEVAHRLIRSASRALAAGGTMLVVYNSHLSHRRVIEQHIGPARQLARDRNFTLVSAVKR